MILVKYSLDCQHNLDRALSNDEMEKERKARDSLIQSGLITFTPSRYSDGKRITNYDDRYESRK